MRTHTETELSLAPSERAVWEIDEQYRRGFEGVEKYTPTPYTRAKAA
jgi:hypothetical protein